MSCISTLQPLVRCVQISVRLRSSRSWCKVGVWASLDGKIGKLTMNPDSDSEVKLQWANGQVSHYVKISRLTMVVGGKHASHPHTLAPSNHPSSWICDVCRERCVKHSLKLVPLQAFQPSS